MPDPFPPKPRKKIVMQPLGPTNAFGRRNGKGGKRGVAPTTPHAVESEHHEYATELGGLNAMQQHIATACSNDESLLDVFD